MSAQNKEGCVVPSYGSYSSCSNCGISGQWLSWDSLDTSISPNTRCQTSPPYGKYTPDNRCDFRKRNSRNIYDWKQAFYYGSTSKSMAAPGIDYGSNGAGCMYIGSITPTGASFPWGYELGGGGTYNDATYGGYVGDLNKSRQYSISAYDLGVRKPSDVCSGPTIKRPKGFLNTPFLS